MYPDTDPVRCPDAENADLMAEGEGYAAALLQRIAAGESGPADFAHVVAFVGAGPMLHGFAVAMLEALRLPSGPQTGQRL